MAWVTDGGAMEGDREMGTENAARKARRLIEDTPYLTLATADASGKPWSCPVYFAYDEAFTLYWVSFSETVHAANIRVRPQVGISILGQPPDHEGDGVYFDALAAELHEVGRGGARHPGPAHAAAGPEVRRDLARRCPR